MTWKYVCVSREDREHCNCWYDGEPCCVCGEAGDDYMPCVEYKPVEGGYSWLGGIFFAIVFVELAFLAAFC